MSTDPCYNNQAFIRANKTAGSIEWKYPNTGQKNWYCMRDGNDKPIPLKDTAGKHFTTMCFLF